MNNMLIPSKFVWVLKYPWLEKIKLTYIYEQVLLYRIRQLHTKIGHGNIDNSTLLW
jgi:hypothetical protein